MTSGASISSDSADLPRNRARSSRKALAVPTATDSSVTQAATITLVPTLLSSGPSAKSPVRPPAAAQEPVEREAAPRRRRIVRVVEREHGHDHERQEQEREERRDVAAGRVPGQRRARQRRDHERLITSPKRWPVSFSPSQTIAVDSTSSRKPNAAPCSQLKRVMNWV